MGLSWIMRIKFVYSSIIKNKTVMAKKKLREWEIPMNLSNQERVLYKMTVVDQIEAVKIIAKKFGIELPPED